MNNIPTMMLTTGFKTDQNGVLTEIDVPNVVTTLNAPTKIKFNGTAINWAPSSAAALQEIIANNVTTINSSLFNNYTNLQSITFNNVLTLTCSNTADTGVFRNCTKLTTVNLPKLQTMNASSTQNKTGVFMGCSSLTTISLPSLTAINETSHQGGAFYNCTSLSSVSLPELQTVGNGSFGYTFGNCASLSTIELPKILRLPTQSTNAGMFLNCTGLQSVQLGSEGHAVSDIGNYTFQNCTQQGLTITVYTADGNAISGSPWGATNATIVYEEA